jgi:hypothetical protein
MRPMVCYPTSSVFDVLINLLAYIPDIFHEKNVVFRVSYPISSVFFIEFIDEVKNETARLGALMLIPATAQEVALQFIFMERLELFYF